MLRLISSAVVATLSFSSPAKADACDGKESLAFVNVTVVRPESTQTDPNQTVLVKCKKIAAVGPHRLVRVPSNARIVQSKGKYLSPGLVDAHAHRSEWDWFRKLYLVYGVTTIRDLQGSPEALAAKAAVANREAIGPTIYLSSAPIHGTEAEWKGTSVNSAAQTIVQKAKAAGYEYIKTYYQLSPDQFRALASATQQAGMALVGHVPRSMSLDQTLGDEWSIEHLTGFDDALEDPARHVEGPGSAMLTLRRFAVADESKIAALANEVARSRVWQIPTLFAYDLWAYPDEMKRMVNDPATVELVGRKTIEQWTAPNPWYVIQPEKQTEADRTAIAAAASVRKKMVKALYDAGALLAVGTDAKEVYVTPGLSMHQEMKLYRDAGIPTAAVLRMATLNGAKVTKHEDEFGSIDVGKRADLLLLDANPLEDLEALKRPAAVVAAGRYFSRSDLDQLTNEVRAFHRNSTEPAAKQ